MRLAKFGKNSRRRQRVALEKGCIHLNRKFCLFAVLFSNVVVLDFSTMNKMAGNG